MPKSRWARRLFFFGYVTAFGALAHCFIVHTPHVYPLLLGMIAPLLMYLRLGALWAFASYVLVMLPIAEPSLWSLAAIHGVAAVLSLWLGRWSRSILLVFYLLAMLALISHLEPQMPWTMQWFAAAIQTTLLLFNQYAATMMLDITQTADERKEQTLQSQLSGRIAVYSAIPAGLLVLLGLYGATVLELSQRNLRAYEQSMAVAHRLQTKLSSYVAELELAVQQRGLANDQALLSNLVKHQPEFISALITDANGNVTAFYKEFIDHDISGDNVSFRPYFSIPRQTGQPAITDMFRGQQLGQDLIFAVSVPLTSNGKFDGVLEVSVAVNRLTQSFPKLQPSQQENYILLDGQGYKLWGTEQTPSAGSHINLSELRLVQSKTLFEDSALLNGPIPYISNQGEHLLQQYAIEGTAWQLLFYSEMAPSYWKYNSMVAITLVLLILATLLVRHSAAKFVQGYTDTLSALVRLIRQLDVADKAPALPVLTTTSREFEQLQQSYLHLQRRIQQAVRELQQVLKEKTELSDELELRVQQRTHELALERDKANHLAAVKTRFLANMSHELRTPLTVIQGYAEQLTQSLQGDETKRQLQALRDHSDFLLHIVNDILDSAKIEEGKLSITPEVFALKPLLQQLQQACLPLAQRKQLQFELTIKAGVPDWIYSDSFRLRQILFNLLSNALKFTQQGFVRLTIRLDGRNLLIEVTDSGPGISAEQQVRIFEAFEQADASTTRQFGGTGLGLFISRRLAELLGATLTLHSTLGFGSCFSLQLPLIELTQDAIEQASQTQQTAVDDAHLTLQGTVLLSDDVEELRTLFRGMLEPYGLRCLEAQDGAVALHVLKQQAVDVLLLDMHMPVLDGMGVLFELSSWSNKPAIIGLTADVQTDVHQLILAAGAQKVLTKPVTKQQLLAAIQPFVASTVFDDTPTTSPQGPSVTTAGDAACDGFDELQQSYIESFEQVLQSISTATPNELQALLHKIKGTAACLDFTALSQCAQQAEQQLKAAPETTPDLAAVQAELVRLQHALLLQHEHNQKGV